MSRFPKIDQACPLDAAAQRGVGDFCGHCNKAVHSLDAMSDAARAPCGPMPAAAQEAWLASVATRLGH